MKTEKNQNKPTYKHIIKLLYIIGIHNSQKYGIFFKPYASDIVRVHFLL